jgi:hypothetical protein
MIPIVRVVSRAPVTVAGTLMGWASICVCTPILIGGAVALRLADKVAAEIRRRIDVKQRVVDREMLRRMGWVEE